MESCQHEESVACRISMRFITEEEMRGAHELLLTSVACTSVKADCIECNLSIDTVNPTQLLYTEKWGSERAFIGHTGSHEFKRVLHAIDLCSEVPDIKVKRLYTDSGIACFETILQQAAAINSG